MTALQPTTPLFDLDVERDDAWPLPEPRAWDPQPTPSLRERIVTALDEIFFGDFGE